MEKKELQEQELLAIVKSKFPKISWQIYEVFNNGRDNQVLLLDKSIVFRFPRNEYAKATHQREKKLLATIKKHVDIAIPHYQFLTDDNSCVGYSAIPGIPMTVELYHKKISPISQKNVQKQLAKFLTQLHTIPVEQFEKMGYPKELTTSNEWTINFQNDLTKICGHLFSKEELHVLLAYIKELQEKGAEYRVMTHSDIQEKNIFINEKLTDLSGIIDFSDARITDPVLDFDSLREYGDEFVAGVYKAYQGKKDDDFLERSKFYRKRGFIYGLIHAVEHKKDVEKHLADIRNIFFGNT